MNALVGVPVPDVESDAHPPAMPLHPDPHAEADLRSFLEALTREGLPRRAEAARVTEAVACALALRLTDPAFDAVRELLPQPFKGRLAACERHRDRDPPAFGREEDFLTVVGEDLGSAPDEAETAARAVFHALRLQLSEDAQEELARRLPEDLEPLWSLAS